MVAGLREQGGDVMGGISGEVRLTGVEIRPQYFIYQSIFQPEGCQP